MEQSFRGGALGGPGEGPQTQTVVHGPQGAFCSPTVASALQGWGADLRPSAVPPRRGPGLALRPLHGQSPERQRHSSSRYLNFYKQTMDLLTGNGIVSSQEVTLPIVSAAISHLWQTLSEERKAILLQTWAQKHSGLPGLAVACPEPVGAEGSVKDSGVDSQGASCSLVSTPEEVSSPVGWRRAQRNHCHPPPLRPRLCLVIVQAQGAISIAAGTIGF